MRYVWYHASDILREEAAQEEFIPFLKEFYRIRYDETGKKIDQNDLYSDVYIEYITKFQNLTDWLAYAMEKPMEGYQISSHHYSIKLDDWKYLTVHEQSIILSLTGKVWMECYGYLFRFLLECIRLRLPQFKLKDSLSIFLTD